MAHEEFIATTPSLPREMAGSLQLVISASGMASDFGCATGDWVMPAARGFDTTI